MSLAVETRAIERACGSVRALRGVTLSVPEGMGLGVQGARARSLLCGSGGHRRF